METRSEPSVMDRMVSLPIGSIRTGLLILVVGLLITGGCFLPGCSFRTGPASKTPENNRIRGRSSGWIEHGTFSSTYLPGEIQMPVLPVWTGNRRLSFLLDTGSPFTLVPKEQIPGRTIEKQLLKRKTIRYPGSEERVSFVLLSSLRIGQIDVRRAEVGLSSLDDPRFSGIIGMNLLKNVIVHIDTRRGRTKLSVNSANRRSGRKVPFELERERIAVSVTIRGRGPFQFYLDTGSEMTALSPELAGTLRSTDGASRTNGESDQNNVLCELKAVHMNGVSLGSVAAVALNRSSFTEGFDGILGMNAFQDDVLTIDFNRRVLRVH